MRDRVSFRQMKDGTADEYQFLLGLEESFASSCGDRILAYMSGLSASLSGYQVDRLEHCLQTASRAYRDSADVDMVVSALLHDVGDLLSPYNHAEFAASILRPYVHERCVWVVEKHAIFQKYYYVHHYGGDPTQREEYVGHPHYQACVDFCERWDQASFDPDYDSFPLEFFAPMVREVFSRSVRRKG